MDDDDSRFVSWPRQWGKQTFIDEQAMWDRDRPPPFPKYLDRDQEVTIPAFGGIADRAQEQGVSLMAPPPSHVEQEVQPWVRSKSHAQVVREQTGEWRCLCCGAESMDEGMFEDAGLSEGCRIKSWGAALDEAAEALEGVSEGIWGYTRMMDPRTQAAYTKMYTKMRKRNGW